MIRLMIVDDEEMTRDGLKNSIQWDELGIESVETANNGLTALEKASVFKPDILLTDVKMPKMDGIQLAGHFRMKYPECKIIFLSGYTDKEYLKSAIHLKAMSYIEKPIKLREVISVVKNTIAEINEESKKKADDQKIKESLAESKPLLREKIALALIDEYSDPMKYHKYNSILFRMPLESLYTAAVILVNWKDGIDNLKKDAVKRSILNFFCSDSPGEPKSHVAGFAGDEEIAWITAGNLNWNGSSNCVAEVILKKLNELSANEYSVSIGIGSPVKGLQNINKSYYQASIAANKQFYHGVNKVYYFCNTETKHFTVDKTLFEEFKELLKLDNWQEASDAVRKLTQEVKYIEDSDINFIKNTYFNILMIIVEVAKERDLINLIVENEKKYMWKEFGNIKTLSELSDYLQNYLITVSSQINKRKPLDRKTYEIMKYIRNNYSKSDLSIKSIAEHTYLSHSYLCTLFKKSTGKTVNEFLTEVRIEKAKELLKNTKMKLYEIASLVGIPDTNYFSVVFKKHEGTTPSEYRERF
jgi:two-component system response regulator YesN